jgi:exodeoxyribonuclease V gamma subunit
MVPSAAMKAWLRMQMAQDPELGISAGIEMGFVEPVIHHLFDLLSDSAIKQTDAYEPSELELALALEESLTVIATTSHPLPKEWMPLLQYIRQSETKIHTSKRIRALACNLAKLFQEYGLSGGRMVADFKTDVPNWQILLWQQMEWIFAKWNYPAKKLEAFQIDPSIKPTDIQIHVFGLSFLSPLHHRFLCQISLHLPVYYYLLSPCQKFWGDVLSDKESSRLHKYWINQEVNPNSLETLDEFLRDCNPLLANFGRLGREMAAQIEPLDSQSTEIYALPESVLQISSYGELISDEIVFEPVKKPLTLLEAVQADLLLLRSAESGKIPFNEYDGSIQIHAVPKKAREVQVIYDVLLSIIDKHRHDANPILPSDIFVMAPKIEEYAPFIKDIFEGSDSVLDIQLMDLQVPSQEVVIQGFLHLFSLSHGRWEASALLQLFDYAPFQKKHHLNGEDVLTIKKWIKNTGIYWGKDHTHREEILKQDYAKENSIETVSGTWENGFNSLLEGLSMILPKESDQVEFSQSDLLGGVIHLVRSLQADLQPLMDGTQFSLEDWSIYLKCLQDSYFLSNEDDGCRVLTEQIESFGKASKRLSGSTFTFETIYHHLQEGLSKATFIYKESNVQAVRFSSLLPMRAVPAKVVVLMGMDDGQFPGNDQLNTLNLLLNNRKADYHPSRVDFDRYMFLESMLSARQYFILSYVSQTPGTAKAPSLLVKELISYLDHTYSVNENKPSTLCLYNHPLVPFHRLYFSENSRFKSYSQKNYLAALAYYHLEKNARQPFIPDFMPVPIKHESCETIELKDLLAFSKNPLKFYSNKVLGIYLDRDEDREIKDEEDVFLSNLNASILTKDGLFSSTSAMLKKAEKSGMLPQGAFKEAASLKIQCQIDQYRKNFKHFGIDIEEMFTLELMEHYSESELTEKQWKLPPLILENGIKIVGSIEHVCSKGLVLFYEDSDKKALEHWPAYLVLQCLIEINKFPIEPQMIFIKGNKTKIRRISAGKEALEDYLDYYLKARTSPSPLLPDHVKHVIAGNAEEFKAAFKEDDPFRPEYDQYSKWFKRNSSDVELGSSIAHWQTKAQQLFMELLTEGKKGGKK